MAERIYVDVGPLLDDSSDTNLTVDGNNLLCDRFEVRFTKPVSGEWLIRLIDKTLEEAYYNPNA